MKALTEGVELGFAPTDADGERNRPPLSASSEAVVLANQSGWYCGATNTLVPIPIRSVDAAAQVSVRNGS